MKKFMKNIPGQIARTFSIMIMCFSIISLAKGIDTVPVARLLQLFLLSVIGGIWMEFAFGTCIINKMADVKRLCIFIVPFAIITFICAVVFRWITELGVIRVYIKFAGIFVGCWVFSMILFEIEHRIRGKKYTEKLKEYQNGSDVNES